MIEIGIIKGVQLRGNTDNDPVTTMLQVQLSDPDDIQSVELFTQAGQESNPPIESEVIVLSLSQAYKVGIAVDDLIVPSMATGEKKIYSISGGSISAFINFLNTGILELNGNTNFAVKFNELETAFNQLKTDHDNLITLYNAHTHVETGGTTSPTTSQGSPSTADISPAKSTTVKL